MLMVTLRPSRWLAVMLVVMHLLAWVSAWLANLSLPAMFATGVLLGASLAYSLRQLWGRWACRAMRLDEQCSLSVQCGGNPWQEAMLQPGTFVSPYLAVLNFRLPDQKAVRHVVIFSDSINAEQFRQLRVLLRWKCGKENGPGRT